MALSKRQKLGLAGGAGVLLGGGVGCALKPPQPQVQVGYVEFRGATCDDGISPLVEGEQDLRIPAGCVGTTKLTESFNGTCVAYWRHPANPNDPREGELDIWNLMIDPILLGSNVGAPFKVECRSVLPVPIPATLAVETPTLAPTLAEEESSLLHGSNSNGFIQLTECPSEFDDLMDRLRSQEFEYRDGYFIPKPGVNENLLLPPGCKVLVSLDGRSIIGFKAITVGPDGQEVEIEFIQEESWNRNPGDMNSGYSWFLRIRPLNLEQSYNNFSPSGNSNGIMRRNNYVPANELVAAGNDQELAKAHLRKSLRERARSLALAKKDVTKGHSAHRGGRHRYRV